MTATGEPGPHPLVGRQRHLIVFLRAAYAVALLLAVAAVVLPGDAGTAAGVGLIATLVATPALRVGWLVARWVRRRDVRFATVAAGLLAVMAAGALAAL